MPTQHATTHQAHHNSCTRTLTHSIVLPHNRPVLSLSHMIVQRMYQQAAGKKKKQLCTTKYARDEDFPTFQAHVESNNIFQVKARLRNKARATQLVTAAEAKYGNTPLHRAVSLGFVEMSRTLLEAGANVDEVNTMGDAPIHCCWRFWKSDTGKFFLWRKNPYLITTRQQQEDFARMARMLGGYLPIFAHRDSYTKSCKNT